MTCKIMIVTGEASGDLHGANLVRALQKRRDDLQFCGMGGDELKSCGVEILFDATKVSVVGISEVFSVLPDIFMARKILRARLKKDRPALLILIDLPDFNLLLARTAKKLSIPVYHYILPSVWAWRPGRTKSIAKYINKSGVILPFEEDFFRKNGVDAEYVGHPLLDTVAAGQSVDSFRQLHEIKKDSLCVGFLPGSRKREISSLLPDFLKAAELLQASNRQSIVFLIPKASTLEKKVFNEAGLSNYKENLDILLIEDNRYDLMAACDCVVAASGTVTLELAILGVPMVVTYRLAPLSYKIGKIIVKIDHFSLVNLILGENAVVELLQDEVTPQRILKELSILLHAYTKRKKMRDSFTKVQEKLGEPGASDRVAESVLQLLDEQ